MINDIENLIKARCPDLDTATRIRLAVEIKNLVREKFADLPAWRGARAMFDSISDATANNWHGIPEINEQCQKENEIAMRFAADALYDFDQYLHTNWKDINVLTARIHELEQQLKQQK